MTNSIKCNVKECKYNDEKNQSCLAKIVDVSSACTSSTCTSSETMCQTFIPKN